MVRERQETEGHRFDGLAEKVEVDEQVGPHLPVGLVGAPAASDNARQAARAARVRAARGREARTRSNR
jgi:hypothetical protein